MTATILVGLVVTLLTLSLAGHPGASLGAPRAAPLSTTSQGAHALKSVHPSAGPTLFNTTGSASITTVWGSAQDIPTSFSYTIALTNGTTITTTNVSLSVAIWAGAVLIANLTQAVTNGTATYSQMVTYPILTSTNYGGGTLPTGSYSFKVWITSNNTSNPFAMAKTNVSNTLTQTLNILNVPVVVTSGSPTYTAFPFWFNFTAKIAGTSGIVYNGSNVAISVAAAFVQGQCTFPVGVSSCYAWNPQVIENASETFNASGAYAVDVNAAWLQPTDFLHGQYPEGQWQMTAWMTVTDSANSAISGRTGAGSVQVYPTINPVTASILGPSGNAVLSTGNITISTQYSGSYIASANVSVYSGSTLAYVQGIITPGPGTHGSGVTWFETVPGTYKIILTVVGQTATATAWEWVNVTAAAGGAGSTVYINTTTYHNTTVAGGTTSLISGLSNGAAAALLLAGGTIVGLVVAMILGMMMWGGTKPQPAQPWSSKSSTPNECSVCHQVFTSEDELKEHQKSAHGMG
ncbi:MAG: hypothetical protein L3K09_01320 [Thermoplasmata archaeon]|nr:hypothetical protein [Thermoplasmata archaeon]